MNLILAEDSTVAVERFGALSPDGYCYTFDARANGYVRGEGGGVVVLKPLADAIADGDDIHCILAGSAVNNDGGGEGLTVPDRAGQEAVLTAAYEQAGISPAAVGYVELHGTGTPPAIPSRPPPSGPFSAPGVRPGSRCWSAPSRRTSATSKAPPVSPASSRPYWPCATGRSRRPCTTRPRTRPSPWRSSASASTRHSHPGRSRQGRWSWA